MDDNTLMLVVGLMVAIVVPLSLVLAFRLIGRLRRVSDQPLSQDIRG